MNSDDLRRTLTLANDFKEGDLLVGGTRDDRVRSEARSALAGTRIKDIRKAVLIDDGVTAAIERGRDRSRDSALDSQTVEQLKTTLLAPAGADWARAHRDSLPSEVIAAITKVMTDDELGAAAQRLYNPIESSARPDEIAIGAHHHFGSRIQPNSPGDDEDEILFSILEGLAHCCGDVVVGLNPAADDLETIVRLEQLLERVVRRLELPTRYCVLSDIVKQHQALSRTRVDVGFQSLAGTSSALAGMVGLDVDGILDLARSFKGLYFETGQGSAVTNGASEGVDMVTLEARTYGVARHIRRATGAWMIVNDVAGFIGPEVFRTPEQLERACLEDTLMAKLHGITMGLDVCATFHMGIPPAALREVTERVVDRAAPAYLMAVAGNADPMLGYLTTAFRDHQRLRRRTGRRIASAMQRRLEALGLVDTDAQGEDPAARSARLYAGYAKAGGDHRTVGALADEARQRTLELRERGFDLGNSAADDARLDAIYENARHALYAHVDEGVVRHACPTHVRVRTEASDRDTYLAHPPAGEQLRGDHARLVAAMCPRRHAQVQIVISDGLNANAVNEHLRNVLPSVRRLLAGDGCRVSETDVVVQNGRVRAGYHVGALTEPDVVVHLLGERPGTGLNTLSAYLTYGKDEAGRVRWDPRMDHSCTTAVCGVHPSGKPPDVAASEIARTVTRMLEQKRSGVALRA
jgi:ethanolamine ammonia-lyase large subunit